MTSGNSGECVMTSGCAFYYQWIRSNYHCAKHNQGASIMIKLDHHMLMNPLRIRD